MKRSTRKHTNPDLGVLAGQVLFSVQKELFTTLAQQGHPDLRPQHGAVMAYLDEQGTRATDLATMSGQHKQVIGTLIDELETLGYVTRQPDPTDRRAKLIVPTERGIDEMTRSDAIVAAIEQRHAQTLGQDTYDAFKQAFQHIARNQRAWNNPT